MNLTLIDFRNNPDLVRGLAAAARQDRARRIGLLLGNALAHVFSKEPRRAARTHLARQG